MRIAVNDGTEKTGSYKLGFRRRGAERNQPTRREGLAKESGDGAVPLSLILLSRSHLRRIGSHFLAAAGPRANRVHFAGKALAASPGSRRMSVPWEPEGLTHVNMVMSETRFAAPVIVSLTETAAGPCVVEIDNLRDAILALTRHGVGGFHIESHTWQVASARLVQAVRDPTPENIEDARQAFQHLVRVLS